MRILALALLLPAACASAPVWDGSAEAELKELERRHVEAASLRWTSESPVTMPGPDQKPLTVRIRTEASFQGADRFKMVMTVQGVDGMAISVQSDGREILTTGMPHGGGGRKSLDGPGIGPAIRRFFFRAGFLAASHGNLSSVDVRKPSDLDAAFPVDGVRFGEDGRVGDRDAKSIRYRLRTPGALSLEVTLWVDPRTRELLRRDFRNFKGEVVSETFSETDFAASFPDGHFDLPKDAK